MARERVARRETGSAPVVSGDRAPRRLAARPRWRQRRPPQRGGPRRRHALAFRPRRPPALRFVRPGLVPKAFPPARRESRRAIAPPGRSIPCSSLVSAAAVSVGLAIDGIGTCVAIA